MPFGLGDLGDLIIREPRHPSYAGGSGNEPHNVYARKLYSSIYGHALFSPTSTEPDPMDQQYPLSAFQRLGIHIGDVGFLEDGGFVRVFNILNIHQNENGLPPASFSPFSIPEVWHQMHDANELPAGQTLVSQGTSKTSHGLGISVPLDPAAGVLLNATGRIEFSTEKDESATLCLPTGADWYRVVNHRLMKPFAIKHGRSWIAHINGDLGYSARNGSILLVTGYARSMSYATSVIAQRNRSHDIKFALSLASFAPGVGWSISWSHATGLTTHVKPNHAIRDESSLVSTYDLFVRGYLLSIRKDLTTLFKTKVSVQDDSKSYTPFSNRKDKHKESQSHHNASNESDTPNEGGGASAPGSQRGMGELVNVSDEKDFHPLLLINDILLDLEPRAALAISHDDDLFVLLNDGESIPDRETLKERLIQRFDRVFDLDEESGLGIVSTTPTISSPTQTVSPLLPCGSIKSRLYACTSNWNPDLPEDDPKQPRWGFWMIDDKLKRRQKRRKEVDPNTCRMPAHPQ